MNQKKARALRKSMGMTKENFRQKEYGVMNKVEKVVYFKNNMGELTPTKTTRYTLVNKNLYLYRKTKKGLKNVK